MMTRNAFEQQVLCCLREQQLLHPAMQQQDAVKLVFQAMLGPGHLLSARETVEKNIACEMDQLPADPAEPLCENLSPSWCRLNLRRAKEERITPSMIAGMMLDSGPDTRYSRQDVFAFCEKLAETGEKPFIEAKGREMILDEAWLPSHSPVYRERYRPAYRVIPAEWILRMEAIRNIAKKHAGSGRILITIDGPCACGKTTLADRLAEALGAAVVHTDDFVVPHALKTEERLAVPGGNCDAERLRTEVVLPWKEGRAVRLRRYDCRKDLLLPEATLPDTELLILEGSYSNLPGIREYADVRVFMDVPREIREERLARRESVRSLQTFRERWIPLEEAYFKAFRLPDPGCILIRG